MGISVILTAFLYLCRICSRQWARCPHLTILLNVRRRENPSFLEQQRIM